MPWLHRQPLSSVRHARRRGRRRDRRGSCCRGDHDDQRRVRRGHDRTGHRGGRRATTTSSPPRGCTRTRPSTASTRSSPTSTIPTSSRSANAGSTTSTTTRREPSSARRSPHRSNWPINDRLAVGDPHPRRVGRHVRHPRRRGHAASRRIFHCFTGGPDEARQCLDARCVPLVQWHRHVQDRDRICTKRRDCARSIGCSPRPTARTSRPCRTAANRTNRRSSRTSSRALAELRGADARRRSRRYGGERMPCVPGHSSVAFSRPADGKPHNEPLRPPSPCTCLHLHGGSAPGIVDHQPRRRRFGSACSSAPPAYPRSAPIRLRRRRRTHPTRRSSSTVRRPAPTPQSSTSSSRPGRPPPRPRAKPASGGTPTRTKHPCTTALAPWGRTLTVTNTDNGQTHDVRQQPQHAVAGGCRHRLAHRRLRARSAISPTRPVPVRISW